MGANASADHSNKAPDADYVKFDDKQIREAFEDLGQKIDQTGKDLTNTWNTLISNLSTEQVLQDNQKRGDSFSSQSSLQDDDRRDEDAILRISVESDRIRRISVTDGVSEYDGSYNYVNRLRSTSSIKSETYYVCYCVPCTRFESVD